MTIIKLKFKLVVSLFLITTLLFSCGEDPLEPYNLVPATVDQDVSIPTVEVNGTSLHLETFRQVRGPRLRDSRGPRRRTDDDHSRHGRPRTRDL